MTTGELLAELLAVAIAHGQRSFAYVLPDGDIIRYGVVVGFVDDLEFLPAPWEATGGKARKT